MTVTEKFVGEGQIPDHEASSPALDAADAHADNPHSEEDGTATTKHHYGDDEDPHNNKATHSNNSDGHAHHHEDHHAQHHQHEGPVPFYAPPRQRQRWGDTQVAPHKNWGDVFFDLFYVAAAYNLGNVLRGDPTATGLLYTAGLFFPIANLWACKTYYDSRFYYTDDYWHRGYEIALLLALATAVLHIRPVSVLSDPATNADMFAFCLGICAAFFLATGRLVEVMLCQKLLGHRHHQTGLHPEAFAAARRDALGHAATGAFFVSAAAYSGTQFYRGTPDAHLGRPDAAGNPEDNTAIWLLLGGTFADIAWFLLVVAYFSTRNDNHRQVTVPMNVDYTIHRYGEWTMLMLGESVLSLLIVNVVDTTGYYQTFLCGLISIILLQYLHFQSQPSDPDKHAMRRSLPSSFAFYWLMQVYSLSLIILGTADKMLLLEFVYTEEEVDNGSSHRRSLFFHGLDQRWLAGGVSAALTFSAQDREERIAHFFSGSLATIFFCLDAMSLAHRGISAQLHRCECVETKAKKVLAFSLVVCRTALLLFVATLSQYETDPNTLATIGLFAILAQLCVRFVGFYVFHADEDYVEEKAIELMINYNTARMHDRPHHTESTSRH